MFRKKPSVAKIARKRDLSGLIKLVNGSDQALAAEAIPILANLIVTPFPEGAPSIAKNEEETSRSLRLFLDTNSNHTLEIMLSILENEKTVGGGIIIAVRAAVTVGGIPRLIDSLNNGLICNQWTRDVVWSYLMETAIHTMNSELALSILRGQLHKDNIIDPHSDDIWPVLLNCSENQLLGVLKSSKNYAAVVVLLNTLRHSNNATEESLRILADLPTFYQPGVGYNTSRLAQSASNYIKERLGQK
jgi:hypothetical protein